jgi:hypothetical protein
MRISGYALPNGKRGAARGSKDKCRAGPTRRTIAATHIGFSDHVYLERSRDQI